MPQSLVDQFHQAMDNALPPLDHSLPAKIVEQFTSEVDMLLPMFYNLDHLIQHEHFSSLSRALSHVNSEYQIGPINCCRQRDVREVFGTILAFGHSTMSSVYITQAWSECRDPARRLRKVEESFQRWTNYITRKDSLLRITGFAAVRLSAQYSLTIGLNTSTIGEQCGFGQEEYSHLHELSKTASHPLPYIAKRLNEIARKTENTDGK